MRHPHAAPLRPPSDQSVRQIVSAVVLLQRRCNQLERKLEQFIEDTSSMMEDLYDTIKCHKETEHGT